jgi:hypothetical protein
MTVGPSRGLHQVALTAFGGVRNVMRNLWKSDTDEASHHGKKAN